MDVSKCLVVVSQFRGKLRVPIVPGTSHTRSETPEMGKSERWLALVWRVRSMKLLAV